MTTNRKATAVHFRGGMSLLVQNRFGRVADVIQESHAQNDAGFMVKTLNGADAYLLIGHLTTIEEIEVKWEYNEWTLANSIKPPVGDDWPATLTVDPQDEHSDCAYDCANGFHNSRCDKVT